MKNIVVNYDVMNKKVDKNIIILSDLHDYPGKKKCSLSEDVKKEKPELIIVAGDILQGVKYRDKKTLEELKYFLSSLSESCPVVLDRGNHDLIGFDEEAKKGYLSLEDARKGMVFPLFDSTVDFGDVTVTGLCPCRAAFAPSGQESGYALLRFAEDFKNHGQHIIDKSKFNIIVFHNPKLFAQAVCFELQRGLSITPEQRIRLYEICNILLQYDMGAGGHLHNGYLLSDMIEKNPEKHLDYGYWEMPARKNIEGKIPFNSCFLS